VRSLAAIRAHVVNERDHVVGPVVAFGSEGNLLLSRSFQRSSVAGGAEPTVAHR
jgi:hypothetical protein